LLDVQLDERAIAAWGARHRRERAAEPGGGAHLVQARALAVAQRGGAGGVERAGHQAAADTADAEARGFFGSEQDQLDGTARPDSGALQGADGLQGAEHANRAIVTAGVRDGIDVRAAGHRGQLGGRSFPAGEGVAHGVFAHVEAGRGAELLQPAARAAVGLRENDAGDGGRGRIGNQCERLQLCAELIEVDVESHRGACGWRFQSL